MMNFEIRLLTAKKRVAYYGRFASTLDAMIDASKRFRDFKRISVKKIYQ